MLKSKKYNEKSTNLRPGRANWVYTIRRKANQLRSLFYFAIKCPWVRRHGMVRVPWDVEMWSPRKDIILGDHVQFGRGCCVQCDLEIGNNVLIARNVAFINRDDHEFRTIGKTIWDSPRGDRFKTVVEDDVWIGHGAIILSGVTIGRGSIVGAGAVVTKDVPRYAIVFGSPANAVRTRFTPEDIHRHERLLGYPKDDEIQSFQP